MSGVPISAKLVCSNQLNETGAAISNFIIVDLTAPLANRAVLNCPLYQKEVNSVTCNWTGFVEEESSIEFFFFSVGTFLGDSSLYASEYISFTDSFSALNLDLVHGQLFYVTITAVNSVGLATSTYANVTVDTDAPTPTGIVWISSDISRFIILPGESMSSGMVPPFDDTSLYPYFQLNVDYTIPFIVSYTPLFMNKSRLYISTLGGSVSKNNSYVFNSYDRTPDVDPRWRLAVEGFCLYSNYHVYVSWDPFVDLESPINRYELSLGTDVGGSDISKGWFKFDVTTLKTLILKDVLGDTLVMLPNSVVYATIRAVNSVGLQFNIYSHSMSILSQNSGIAYDGLKLKKDEAYSSNPSEFSANWVTGDSCKVIQVDIRLIRSDDFVIMDWFTIFFLASTPVGSSIAPTSFTLDVPPYVLNGFSVASLQNSRTYFTEIRLTNAMGQRKLIATDGFSIEIEGPPRGIVFDGPFPGRDVRFQPSLFVFSANWEDCVQCLFVNPGNCTGGEEFAPVFYEDYTPKQCFGALYGIQKISHYQVAFGIDAKSNAASLWPWTPVALNTSYTFVFTKPLEKEVKYFMSVRAFSIPDVYSQSASNGIIGGVALGLVAGIISAPAYISNLDELFTISWSDFLSNAPIYKYSVELRFVDNSSILEQWMNLKLAKSLPSTSLSQNNNSLTSNRQNGCDFLICNSSTLYNKSFPGLLIHGRNYSICVTAYDEALQENQSCTTFLVDVTEPCTGTVRHENSALSLGNKISYSSSDDFIKIMWDGFSDPESDLDSYWVALIDGRNCSVIDENNLYSQLLFDGGNATSSVNFTSDYNKANISYDQNTCNYVTALNNKLVLNALPWKHIGDAGKSNFTFYIPNDLLMDAKLKYVVLIKVVNKAGLYSVVPSPVVMLDNAPPQIGAVRPGGDFRRNHRYQRESNTMNGSVTSVYTPGQLQCDLYNRISFLDPESADIFRKLSKYCYDGACTYTKDNERVSDGVAFGPDQAVLANIGYKLALVFPQIVRATAGAIYTSLKATLSGQYEFNIQVSGVEDIISSVFWWGGDMINFVNPQYGINPDNPGNMENVMFFEPLISYSKESVKIETNLQVQAFGLMFVKTGSTVQDWKLYVWSSNNGDPAFVVMDLNRPKSGLNYSDCQNTAACEDDHFDPSEKGYKYTVVLSTAADNGDRTVAYLYVSDLDGLGFDGVPGPSDCSGLDCARLLLQFYPTFTDIFNAKFGFSLDSQNVSKSFSSLVNAQKVDPTTLITFIVSSVAIPLAVDPYCKFGEPFFDATSAIVQVP